MTQCEFAPMSETTQLLELEVMRSDRHSFQSAAACRLHAADSSMGGTLPFNRTARAWAGPVGAPMLCLASGCWPRGFEGEDRRSLAPLLALSLLATVFLIFVGVRGSALRRGAVGFV